MGWRYSTDWSENDLTDGSYVGFVYVFHFEDGSLYIGSKQLYKRVKDVNKLTANSIENDWREYSSSSKIVNRKISEGMNYSKTILWGFPSMRETLMVESTLIYMYAFNPMCLNLAVLNKVRFPSYGERKRLQEIIQIIAEYI